MTARNASSAPASSAQEFPVYLVDLPEAELAFEAYSALRQQACAQPRLLANGYFIALQDTAYARFLAQFEAGR